MSPLWQRRFARFRKNRRGFWSLLFFLFFFALSLGAELIANDKPILLYYNGDYYFPAFRTYSETTFSGTAEAFETEAVYTDRLLQEWIAEKDGWMLWPLVHYHYRSIDFENPEAAPAAPNQRHLLGTDDQGRDVFARILYGFRISVVFGLMLTAISATIGIIAGAVQGYYGGWVDMLGQRLIEILNSVPTLILLIAVASIVTPDFWSLLIIMALVTWVSLVDVVRAECLKTRNQDYVRAAKALGVSHGRILFRHVLPNALVAGLTLLPIVLTLSITSLTALDFLGFGLPPGEPSLGELLKQGKDNVHATWLLLPGFIVLTVLMSLLVFVGEAVRDAFDPRKAG